MSIATQLTSINDSKQAIKTAIEGKGQVVGAIPLDQYAGKISAITTVGGPVPYTRPAHWRAQPAITPGADRIQLLVEINDLPGAENGVAFIIGGTYTVDWGDGSAPTDYASSVQAYHFYDYATVDNAFITSTGKKQVIVNITPRGGQQITYVTLQSRTAPGPLSYGCNIVEIYASLPNVTNISLTSGGNPYTSTLLQNIVFDALKNGTGISFNGQTAVENITLPVTYTPPANCTDMFRSCNSLINAPMMNTVNVTNMATMFYSCVNLRYVPQYNTANVTNMSAMFAAIRGLTSIPQFNTGLVTNFNQFVEDCQSLTTFPLLDTHSATNMSFMFRRCYALTSIPLLNTSNVTNMANMFAYCFALTSIPELDFTKVTTTYADYDGMFRDCIVLERLPESLKFLPATLTNVGALAANCYQLKYIPPFVNTANWTQLHAPIYNFGPFLNCYALKEIPPMNLSSLATLPPGYVVSAPYSLERSQISGIKFSHTYATSMLGKTALLEVFGNLGSPATTQTLTITNSVGAQKYPVISRTSTTTAGSKVVAQTNTTGLVVGMVVTGTGIMGSRAGTADVTTDTITAAAHGLADGKRMSFTNIGTVTGIAINTPYYVVNGTTDTYQVSLTLGGAPIDLTGTGGAITYQVGSLITAITTNTSVTLDVPATGSQTLALVYRDLDTSIATIRGWTVTG